MSIRLRLTLLYSSIVALTLIAFSAILYATQARTISPISSAFSASKALASPHRLRSVKKWLIA